MYVLYAIPHGTNIAHLWAVSESCEKLHEKAMKTIKENGLKLLYRDINTYHVSSGEYTGTVWIEKVEVI